MSERRKLVSYECLKCGHVGSAEDAKNHAVTVGCRNFRVTTLVVSENGRVVDELVEVFQLGGTNRA